MRLDGIRKVFFLGDLHLGIRNNSVFWADIQKEFLLDWFFKAIDEHGFDPETDILIQEGDVYHSRESINVRIQHDCFHLFKMLSFKFKRGVHVILGNHDVYYKDKNDINSLNAISLINDNIYVHETSTVLDINGREKFLLMPWVEDFRTLRDKIEERSKACDYLVCHADISGLKFNRYVKVQDGLSMSSLKDFKRVYAGHIHFRQEYKNVLYTGVPYQMDRGDRGNTKGFYILDLENDKETFVENTISPTFVKHNLYDLLEKPKEEVYKMFNNNFVDVMLDVNFASKFSVTNFIEQFQDSGYKRIEFFTYIPDDVNIDLSTDGADEFNVFDVFDKYVESNGYKSAIKNELKKNFIRLHSAVTKDKND